MLATPSKPTHAGIGCIAVSLALLLTPMAHADEVATPAVDAAPVVPLSDSLYARMGGKEVINAIADELIEHSATDPKLKRSFEKSNIPRVKKLLGEQLCVLTGGPCVYSGDAMKEVHAGFNIRQDEFYGLVEALRVILEQHHIGLSERNELLALLAPMKRDVVTR
jgi:hemoglobin